MKADRSTGDLFNGLPYGGEPPHQQHSSTSRAAAESVRDRIGPLHRKILGYLHERGALGATDEEMMDALDMGGNTQRPRRRELQLMGRIEESDLTRPTRSGRYAVVWVIIEAPPGMSLATAPASGIPEPPSNTDRIKES